tara:strand:- start:127 stop:690 length:564 start_codon:yes stop_codon:yes gene_type:complete
MNRNKLKQYIKEVIRKELNEQPSFKLPAKLQFKSNVPPPKIRDISVKPSLRFNTDFDAKSYIQKNPIIQKKSKTYSDDLGGSLQKFGDDVKGTKQYKFLDKLASDKQIDFKFKNPKAGKLTFGKIGVDDPLDSETRKSLTTRSKLGDTQAKNYLDKAKTSDIMGVKYTVPFDSTKIEKKIRNLFKKK